MNHWPQLSRPLDHPRLVVISHGGGVQTSTLCLMAARGDLEPMPEMAFFSDTGGEPARVYEYLEWLRAQVPFPIHLVKRPGPALADMAIGVADGSIPRSGSPIPPWFVSTPDGPGMLPKHCSAQFKRDVVLQAVRKELGLRPRQRGPRHPVVELWIGMTTDELFRVVVDRERWISRRHPLIELNLKRPDCIKWLRERQYPVPPKSSCVFCPYRKNAQWRHLRDTAPDDFAEACRVDRLIRRGYPGHEGEAFVHRSLVPLEDADLEDGHVDQLDLPLGADCDACGL